MNKKTQCLVIGAGRIGLPISVSLALAGHEVTILEKNPNRVKMINLGEAPFYEKGMSSGLKKMIIEGRLHASTDLNQICNKNVIVSAIGTGLNENGSPNLNSIDELVNLLSDNFPKGGLLILKTTLPIGMTEIIANKLSHKTGFKLDEEIFVAFSPERIVEGKAMYELKKLPKIVGGIGPNSTRIAKEFVSSLGGRVVEVSNARTAEMCKLLDNSYRMTRFGFAADVAAVAVENEINAYEAIKAANFDYPRNNIPLPSIGVSGYCLTKDPYYLDKAAPDVWKERGFASTWITARKAADLQVDYAFNFIKDHFGDSLNKKSILLAGITYKEDVDDSRLSHGRILLQKFLKEGCEISIWDPRTSEDYIEDIKIIRNNPPLDIDCMIITVPHLEFIKWSNDKKYLDFKRNTLIFDGWGIIEDDGDGRIILSGTGRAANVN